MLENLSQLTVENQFTLAKYRLEIESMSEDQVKKHAIKFFEMVLIREREFQALLAHKWGLK